MFAFTQTGKCGKMMASKEYCRRYLTPEVGLPAENGGMMMERWENRYTHGRAGSGRPAEHTRAERVKNIVLILLAVALLGVGIAGGKAIAFRSDAKDTLLARAMTECSSAVSQTNTLSRSGGSDTAGALGKIRANINAVQVLSDVHFNYYGRALVQNDVFVELYGVIDSYSAKLKNGSSTIDELTHLADALARMQTVLQEAR